MKTYIVSLIHPYYVEYGIVSFMHIIDKEEVNDMLSSWLAIFFAAVVGFIIWTRW